MDVEREVPSAQADGPTVDWWGRVPGGCFARYQAGAMIVSCRCGSGRVACVAGTDMHLSDPHAARCNPLLVAIDRLVAR